MADDKVKVTIYVTPDFKAKLDTIAEAERRTGNQQNVLLLEQAVEQWSQMNAPQMRMRSISVKGDEHRDMVTGEVVDPMTLEPVAEKKAKRPRTTVCPHRLAPDQFCRICDA